MLNVLSISMPARPEGSHGPAHPECARSVCIEGLEGSTVGRRVFVNFFRRAFSRHPSRRPTTLKLRRALRTSGYVCFFLFVVIFDFNYLLAKSPNQSQFLVQQVTNKKASKNALKEDIGSELKKALFSCANLATELGSLQQEIAGLQKRLLGSVEKLVENQRLFRKAKKPALADALKTMRQVRGQLCTQELSVKKLVASLDKNSCLRVGS